MLAIASFILSPFTSIKRRLIKTRAVVDDAPPPVVVDKGCNYGDYCVKATVDMYGPDGDVIQTFMGYSPNMNICNKTRNACERFKGRNSMCGDPRMTINGGECDEVIFTKTRYGMLRQI